MRSDAWHYAGQSVIGFSDGSLRRGWGYGDYSEETKIADGVAIERIWWEPIPLIEFRPWWAFWRRRSRRQRVCARNRDGRIFESYDEGRTWA